MAMAAAGARSSRTTLSIRARLVAAIAAVLVIGGLAITVAAYAYGLQAANAAFDRQLAGAAFAIARSLGVADGALEADLPISAFELLALAPEDRIAYRVIGIDGGTLTGHDWVPGPTSAPGDGPVFYPADHQGTAYRLAAVHRTFSERDYHGTVWVVVGHTTVARSALAWDITGKAMIIVLAAGVVVAGIATFALRAALTPLTAIETALTERDPTDLSPLTVATPRELSVIIEAINRFMTRLAQRVSAMRNLIGDASHQLKTPIAALRVQAELALDEQDPVRLRDAIRRIHGRALNLSRLTEQLLSQALVIHRSDAAPQAELDLRELAIALTDDADQFSRMLGKDGPRLDLCVDPAPVRGDAMSLEEAVRNLINNAYRYGAPPVTVSVAPIGPDAFAIAVSDGGGGFDARAEGRGFERFARRAGSRADSAGLGLAIVKAVADAHGGKIRVSRDDARGFTLSLVLPAARARGENPS